jgi:aquaporin Z
MGTFWLVLGGCGSAVLAAAFPYAATPLKDANFFGLGFLGVALAFGLTVLTMAYAVGHISGGHFNPAVSLGLWAGRRFPTAALVPYIIAQVVGATVAGGLIYLIASGRAGFALTGSNPHRVEPARDQRLRCPLSGRLLAPRLPGHRGRADIHVPDDHPRYDR